MGSGRLCRRSRPGPSFSCARAAGARKGKSRRRRDELALRWCQGELRAGSCFTGPRARADHESHPRRQRRQRTADRDRRDAAARAARGRGRDAAEHPVAADGARVRRRPADSGGRGQGREHRLADASLLPGRRRIRPALVRRISSCERSWRQSSSRRRSRSSRAASACSCSGSAKERSSDCTRRASSSGSGRRRFTC